MQLKTFFALIIAFFIATGFVLGLQAYIFSQPLIPWSMSTSDLESWLAGVFWPITWIVYGLGVLATLIWILKGAKSKYIKATDALSTQIFWWILFIIYIVVSIGIFMAISFFGGWMEDSDNIQTLLWVPPFIVIDSILLFWLPTAIATPRSLRYIPPLSMQLRKLYGG